MELGWCLALLALSIQSGVHCGGHGEKHHSHIKLHVPEFHHHDHHTKVITIHHHHGKPKKEQHHHHHHHHHRIPIIPHHHHHNKKTTLSTHTVKKEHKINHGHHKHRGHHSHHGHHGSHGHDHDLDHHFQDEPPSYSDHNVGNFDNEFVSYTPHTPPFIPSLPTYGDAGFTPQIPRVRGVQHTVKQVKVFDSLPNAFPDGGKFHGYQVTEETEDEDDAFSSINNIQNSFPGTISYIKAVAPGPPDSLNSFTGAIHDPVEMGAPFELGEENSLSKSLAATQPEQFSGELQPDGIDASTVYENDQGVVGSLLSDDKLTDDTPVTFSREAGVQQAINTGGLHTVVY